MSNILPNSYLDTFGTINSSKLLNTYDEDAGYLVLYSEVDTHIKIGDSVYISSIIDSELDNLTSCCDDFPFGNYSNGYKVLNVDITKNKITINKLFKELSNSINLENHYITKINFENVIIKNSIIDSSTIKNGNIYNSDIQQLNIINGIISGCTINSKYDDTYDSLKKIIYDGVILSDNNEKYSYNNIGVSGYTLNLYYNNINNGRFYSIQLSGKTNIINNGYFENCVVDGYLILDGYFKNSKVFPNCTWSGGTWNNHNQSVLDFGTNIWYNGIWENGNFGPVKIWKNGIFDYGAIWISIWENGVFNDGVIFGGLVNNIIINNGGTTQTIIKYGIINNGSISNSIFENGIFNNGSFDYGSFWSGGTWNGGIFDSALWSGGTWNNGEFINSYWNDGTWNNGKFTNSTWKNGTWYRKRDYLGSSFNNSYWSGGTWNNGQFNNSTWYDGDWKYGHFNKSIWNNGDWENGIFIESKVSGNLNWKKGNWRSGDILDNSIVNWSGGTFNNGNFVGRQIDYINLSTSGSFIDYFPLESSLIVKHDASNFGFRIYPKDYTATTSFDLFSYFFYISSANTNLIDYMSNYDKLSLFFITDTNDYENFYITGLTKYLYQNIDHYYDYIFPISMLNNSNPDFHKSSIKNLEYDDIIGAQIVYSGVIYDISIESKIVNNDEIKLIFKSSQKINTYMTFNSNVRILYKNRIEILYDGVEYYDSGNIMEYRIGGLSYDIEIDSNYYTYNKINEPDYFPIFFRDNRKYYIDKLIKNSLSKWYDGKFYNNYFEAYWYGGYFEGGDWNGYNKIYNDFRKPPKSSTQLYKNNLIDNKYRI